MSLHSLSNQGIGTVLFAGLMAYTFWLLRTERLSPPVAVRWILAEGIGLVCLLLWQWLPIFPYTAAMGDRELLIVVTVGLFVFVTYLMLDSLVRISLQTHQIKLLTQELALLRQKIESGAAAGGAGASPDVSPAEGQLPSA